MEPEGRQDARKKKSKRAEEKAEEDEIGQATAKGPPSRHRPRGRREATPQPPDR